MNKRLWENKVQCLRLQQILEARQKKKANKEPPPIELLSPREKTKRKNTKEKISTFTSGAHFVGALRKKGWEYLGSGAYSWVLAKKGSDRVIKVSKYNNDGGWMEYIKWATDQGYTGTFAPKVFSYKWIKGVENAFSISSMERLENTIDNTNCKEDPYLLHSLIKFKMSYSNPNAGVLADLMQPGMDKFTTELQKKFGNSGLDLHKGNFMTRKGGMVVCIDPVSSGSPYTERFRLADYSKNSQALAVA